MSDPNAQTKKRQSLLIGGAVTGILILAGAGMFLFDAGPTRAPRVKPTTVSITAPGSVDDRDAWRAQQAAREKANEAMIQEVQRQLKTQEEQNKRLAQALEKLQSDQRAGNRPGAAAPVDASLLDQPLPGGTPGSARVLQPPTVAGGRPSVSGLNTPLPVAEEPPRRELEIIRFAAAAPGAAGGLPGAGGQGGNIEVLGFPVDEKAKRFGVTKGAAEKRTAIEFIPAGSFVRVAMLNGVDAPTGGQAQSNPLPVAFHVLDLANLANKHRLDIKDCRFIAAAWGDLSSERMLGRTESLTCIINGETVEMPVKGQVMGEDGKVGVRGRLVTKQGQLLANALFSGALSGIGDAFKQSATITSVGGAGVTQTIDPDKVAQLAVGGGVSRAADMLAQYYLKAADKLFPVIETDGGRTVEILITKGAVYNGPANVRDEYRALLHRTGTQTRRYEDD